MSSRMARPLRGLSTRGFSGINVLYNEISIDPKYLIDAHNHEISCLRSRYEKKLTMLQHELVSQKDAKIKWEQREKEKRRDERQRWIKKKRQEREKRFPRSDIELQLTRDKIKLLHEVARLGRNVSAASSLHIIDAIYRKRLEDILGPLPSGPQSVLSAIINGALDEPSHLHQLPTNNYLPRGSHTPER